MTGKVELDPSRPVGTESSKSYAEKIRSGFIDKYLSGGSILEIGFKGYFGGAVPIVGQAIGIDIDYPGYNGTHLPFPDESQDAVYSSHTLEHIADFVGSLRDWFRVLKPGGYLIIAVPHQFLYEKKAALPPRWNFDHKRFYTPASLLQEIETALEPNTYRIRHLADNDAGYDYSRQAHDEPYGCYEIEVVLQKIQSPPWLLGPSTYPATEFRTKLERPNPIQISTDFTITDDYVVFGPYVCLPPGQYEVCFHVRAVGPLAAGLASEIGLDVAEETLTIAAITLIGEQGAKLLSAEMIKLSFASKSYTSKFEFRVLTRGRPFEGTFIFLGVTLQRVGWRPQA